MDKKIRNRILYVSVAGLWVIAIYRTWSNYQAEEVIAQESQFDPMTISPIQFRKDTFELNLPDYDPFLQKRWTPAMTNQPNPTPPPTTNSTIKKPDPPPVTPWPTIQYFGFVKNRNQNSTLCLLSIDGKMMQLSKGQKYQDLLVENVFKDSIKLRYMNEIKTVRK